MSAETITLSGLDYVLLPHYADWSEEPRLSRRWQTVIAGGITGALGGFTGPLPTLWCTLRGWDKDTLRGVVQNFNLAMLALTFVGYLASGVVTRPMLPQMGVVAAALLGPVLLGGRLYAGISPDAFKRVVLAVLACTGVALLSKALPLAWLRWVA